MNGRTKEPTREEVLDSFAVEPSHSRETLEQYLRDFPTFSNELIDLSRELGRIYKNDEKPMSAQDQRLIDAAWQQHMSFETKSLKDPLTDLSVSRLREIALQLDVPRQVVTAFRERRVSVESVPRRFLARLAEALNSTLDLLIAALTIPTVPSLARSYKADGKPSVESAVSFERLLIDAGVDEDKRAILLTDDK
ncbi:MAG: hypothetical protein ACLP1D_07070 [Xanthobacteraceae bacterium]